MAMSTGRDDGEPMMDMNTTPLIDVMLVLLVMFIITLPIQTHAVKIDFPPPVDTPPPLIKPQFNTVTVTPTGQIMWNADKVDNVTLAKLLDDSKKLPVEPELHFAPMADARYEVVDRTMAIIKRSDITKLGFIGNENYANF